MKVAVRYNKLEEKQLGIRLNVATVKANGSFRKLSCCLVRPSQLVRNRTTRNFAGYARSVLISSLGTRSNRTIQVLHDQHPYWLSCLFNSTGFVIEPNGNVASLYKRHSIQRCLVSHCYRSLSSDVPVTHKSELLSVPKGIGREWNCFLCHSFDAASRKHLHSCVREFSTEIRLFNSSQSSIHCAFENLARFILAFLQSVVATGLFMRVLEWERLRTSRHASYFTSDNFNNSSKYLSFRIVFELSGKYHASQIYVLLCQ